MNGADLIVIAVIALMVLGAIASLWYSKKKGKNSCGCNCSGCSSAGNCKSTIVTIEDDTSEDCCKKN